jgi:PPK2 family polyphosphate:nucleotide phosphotransferase
MKDIIERFRVTDGKHFLLKDYDTADTMGYKKEEAEATLQELIKDIEVKQTELYAYNRYALLVIFQAMDAAGKDSAIAHSMSGINPQGCQVYSFKQPSAEDYDHDFLWRHYHALPERGRIGIHNRSHYENVLVTKVHPELVLKEQLPGINTVDDIDKKFWEHRYASIRDFEKHLIRNGTCIIKFYLNVSKDEQKERFLKRLDNPEKTWKFSAADIAERKYWDDYMKAYEEAIEATATEDAPWYILPADKKWFTRIAISTVILHTLKKMQLSYPALSDSERAKMERVKAELQEE